VPSVIMDEGSVAYPLGSHDLNNPFYYPDRTQWCHDMAWRQWTLDEFANGFAWEHVRTCI
jgi:hypothetical protein